MLQKRTFFPLLRILVLLLLFSCISTSVFAAVWQWAVEVKGGISHAGPAKAYLWIPPACKQVKGIVIAQHNMEEISILENTSFRDALSELGFAEVWVSPSFNHQFRFTEGAGEVFNSFMKDLALESGYRELEYAPIVPIGHSAAASWPYYFAAWNPNRTLAAISVSGQWPYFRDKNFAPDIWGNRTIDFIPALETMGEYESAHTWSREGLKERKEHPLMPLSMLAAPAEGHFAASDKKIAYLALYIRKAVQYRMPRKIPKDSPPTLLPVDPTKMGWLMDKWRFNQEPTALAAPVGKYTGDPENAFWFFDEEMVAATNAYQAQYRNMKPQLVGLIQEGKVVPQRNTHQQLDLSFQPLEDGITFKLTPAFLDTVPGGSPRPATWAGLPAGSPIGHAKGGGPILIERICGPFQKLDATTFAVQMERGLGQNLKAYELWFAVTHPGDAEYKPVVQQAKMTIPKENKEGPAQQITFPAIPNQKVTQMQKKSLRLKATSDAKVPVHYYVEQGPVELVGDILKLTKIPPRTKYPIKVTLVAWQYGKNGLVKLQSAKPITQTFYLTK